MSPGSSSTFRFSLQALLLCVTYFAVWYAFAPRTWGSLAAAAISLSAVECFSRAVRAKRLILGLVLCAAAVINPLIVLIATTPSVTGVAGFQWFALILLITGAMAVSLSRQ